MPNILTMPVPDLKAFLKLSKAKPTNTGKPVTIYSPCGRCLLVDISGVRVQLTYTNQVLFVRRTAFEPAGGYDSSQAADGYYILDLAKISRLDLYLRDKVTHLDLDELAATFVGSDYLKGIDFSILTERNTKGKHANRGRFDAGFASAISTFCKDLKASHFDLIYPAKEYGPLQWDYASGEIQALLMPIRR